MAGDREKTAGEAAKEKAERREDGATPKPEKKAKSEETSGEPAAEAQSSEELRAEVEDAREQLAASVEELTDRVDPRPKIEDARRTAADNALPIGGALALLVVVIIWLRRRG